MDFWQLFGSIFLNIAGDVEQKSKISGVAPYVGHGGPGDGVRRLLEGGGGKPPRFRKICCTFFMCVLMEGSVVPRCVHFMAITVN